jgi:hypothetical protein
MKPGRFFVFEEEPERLKKPGEKALAIYIYYSKREQTRGQDIPLISFFGSMLARQYSQLLSFDGPAPVHRHGARPNKAARSNICGGTQEIGLRPQRGGYYNSLPPVLTVAADKLTSERVLRLGQPQWCEAAS